MQSGVRNLSMQVIAMLAELVVRGNTTVVEKTFETRNSFFLPNAKGQRKKLSSDLC